MAITRRRRKIYGEVERDWSDLPSDILEFISRKLYYIDQVNLRAVCKSWSSINSVPSLKQKLPWLLVFDDVDDEYSCTLIDPEYRKAYAIDLNILEEKNLVGLQVHESKFGWLLMSSSSRSSQQNPSSTSFFLYTPFLNRNNFIELPCLSSPFSMATFSSNPSKEDFILLTMNTVSNSTLSISTFRLGDGSWKTRYFDCDFQLDKVKSLVYSKGAFYCSNRLGEMGIFNVAQQDWTVPPKPEAPIVNFFKSIYCQSHDTIVYSTTTIRQELIDVYMVKYESDEEEEEEEIYLVFLTTDPEHWSAIRGCGFILDRTQMIWKRLDRFQDKVMFVGGGCTSFMKETKLFEMANFIYHISGDMLKNCPFSIAYQSYLCTKTYGSLSSQLCKKIWIEPPSQLC